MDGISKARKLVGLLGMLLLLSLASGGAAAAAPATDATPSITSDKADYAPGELVLLSGAHWQPGETVHLRVDDDHTSSWSRDVDVTAGEDGTITDAFNLPDWFVAQYTVTATSASGSRATWTFTDGNVKVGVTPTPYTAPITANTYGSTNCTGGTTGNKSGIAGNGDELTVGIGNTESVRLDAPATASSGSSTRAFVDWTGDLTFTTIAGTNGRSICVAGFQNGTKDISANYAATSATPPAVTAGANQSATEGVSKAIDLGSFADPNGSPWTVEVDWGDGSTDDSFTANAAGGLGIRNHTYADGPATRTVTVKVTDSGGLSDAKTFPISVGNVAPSVTAPAAQTADEGTVANFSLGSFTDPGADTWSAVIDWGDGTTESFAPSSAGTLPARPHTYADSGAYTVKVKVSDDDGGSDEKSFTATVANLRPTASLGNNGPIVEGSAATIAFSGQADASSADRDAGFRYAFRCDGSPFGSAPTYADASGVASTSCEFADDGTKTVIARILDKDGGSSEYTTSVIVTNAKPVVTTSAAQSADEGKSTDIDLGSFADEGVNDGPWSVDVDWGDGSTHTSFTTSSRGALGGKAHTYADGPATRTVTVTVTDKDGGSDAKSFEVTVENVAPAVKLAATNPLTADEGQSKTYTYDVTDPGTDTVLSVDTSCGTGGEKVTESNTNSGGSFECRFPDGPADSIVSAAATDSDGVKGAADTQTVDVVNLAPKVTLSGDPTVAESSSSTYTFTVADPGQDTFSAATGFPDCDATGAQGQLVTGSYTTTATGGSFECTFPDGPATANVKMRVADSDGLSGADSQDVTITGVTNVDPALTSPADQTADEGTQVNVNLGAFSDPGSDSWTIDVDWGDGSAPGTFAASTGTLPAEPHTYDDNGTYTVKVTVSDEDDGSDTKTFSVKVANLDPSATLGNDGPVVEGSAATVAFSGQADASSADRDAGFRYAFRCDGSPFGTAPVYADASVDASTSCEFADDGTKTVRARLLDKDGGFSEYTTDVAVTNAKPAVTAAAAQSADEGSIADVDLGSFADAGADDGPWAIDIDWGDGSERTTFEISSRGDLGDKSHTFADGPATRTVTVQVTDKDGGVNSASFDMTVENVAPTVKLDAANPTSADEGQAKTFSYSISDPGQDTVASVQTSCGTGGEKADGETHTDTGGSFQCRFPDGPADPTVSAAATDSDGATGAADKQEVHVDNVAPTVRLTGDTQVKEGSTHAYAFTVSDPGHDTFTNADGFPDCDAAGSDGRLVEGSYEATATGGSFECAFPDGPATADVKMKVADSDGASATDSEAVTVVSVANVAPELTAPAGQTAEEGASTAIELGSFADAGADTWTLDVDWGDGTPPAAGTPEQPGTLGSRSHAYDDNGTYTVTVKVTDKDGGTDEITFEVAVANVAPTGKLGNDGPIAEGGSATIAFADQADASKADRDAGLRYAFRCDGSAFESAPAYVDASVDASKSCEFADDGTKTVRALIVDKDGGSTEYETDVVVENAAPKVSAAGDQAADEGEDKTFALGSFADAGAQDGPWAVDVDWGDGSDHTTFEAGSRGDLEAKGHEYADDGNYTVKVTVTDKDGASDTAAFVAAVKNVAPTVALAPSNAGSVKEGATSTYAYSISDPGRDTVQSVQASCGTGGEKVGAGTHTDTGGSFECRFPDGPVDTTLSVTATDSDGATSAAATQDVHVDNVAPTVRLTGDTEVKEGSKHVYTFTVSDPGQDSFDRATGYPTCDAAGSDGRLVEGSYEATATGGSFECAFPDGPATADVKMKVADSDGAADDDSESVTVVSVANVAPDVTAPADQAAKEGAATSFDLGSFGDPGADTWTLDVDWGDGTAHGAGIPAQAGTLGGKAHTYDDNGTYTVTVTVTDKNGAVGTGTFEVTVDNVAPSVSAPADHTADEGAAKDFGLGSFTDPGANDGDWTVNVDWGDGSTPAQSQATATGNLGLANHAYDDNGTYTVTVKVTDKDGGSDTKAYKVAVANVAPTADLGNDGPITEGGSATVSFANAKDPSGVDTAAGFTYAIACDGSVPAAADAGPAASRSCSFAQDGTKTVKGIVVDKDGGSREYSTSVVVENAAPVVTAAADQSADEGGAKAFDLGSFADAGVDDGPWSVSVDWGDGSTRSTDSLAGQGSIGAKSHAYADNGTYTVTVKVTDEDGASHTGTFDVAVANVAPSVAKPADDNANEGATKSFGLGSFTDPGADKDWTVDVDWGDGSTPAHYVKAAAGSLGLADHAYDDNGSYIVEVKVTDKDGAGDTQTYTVTVANVAPTATLGNDGPIKEGGTATVSFTGAADVSSKDTAAGFTYAIACDGSVPAAADAGPAASKSCSFAQDGTKTVKGIVVDKDGGSREYSTSVVVNNANPVLTTAADQTALEGAATAFDLGSFTDAGPDSPWVIQVGWGDGSPADSLTRTAAGTIPATSHTYKDNGVYTATVTVTDKDGGKDTKTFKVTVDNVAPKITSFSGTDYVVGPNAFLDGSAGTGLKSTLTTRFTDPGSDTWTGFFSYSDGSPLTETVAGFTTGATRTHAFSGSGCKSASVKVTDDDGGSDTASTQVKVGTGTFQPPLTNQSVTDKLKNGQVVPVKVRITDCAGVAANTLSPAIRLVKGDLTPQNDDAATAITPISVSNADTTGVMRSMGNGDYQYNMQVSLPSLNTDYTVVVYPYGTASPMQLGKVIQATK